jgi:predicted nuclease of predicted toxin-antitoxin system
MLIGKDLDVNKLNSLFEKRIKFPWLRSGIVISGIAIGTLLVSLISQGPEALKSGFSIGIIILFAGLSMILANYVGRSESR